MNISLKSTLIASTALAGLLNLVQFAVSYNYHARDAFTPYWADAAQTKVASSPAVKATAVVATPRPAATPAPTPAPADPATLIAARLSTAGLKPIFAASYLAVQAKTGTPWQILAAVHQTETGQSGDTGRKSSAGATGPMQFMPATFAHYAMDGDANGTKDITDFDDALLTAGNYLRAGGADKAKYTAALYNYNHSNAYVSHVLSIAHRLGL